MRKPMNHQRDRRNSELVDIVVTLLAVSLVLYLILFVFGR